MILFNVMYIEAEQCYILSLYVLSDNYCTCITYNSILKINNEIIVETERCVT